MPIFRKLAVGAAAISVLVAPIAATAAPTFDGARAVSTSDGESDLAGNSSWIIGLVGLIAGIVAIALVVDDDEDSPVSP